MNLPLFIAKRYLFSKKKQHIINIISVIAATGVCVGTFALVVVLSVFNGFDGLIKSYFGTLDPDLKITAVEGKMFEPSIFTDTLFLRIDGITRYAGVIEENALLTYDNRQFIALLKGVPANFSQITGIDSLMVDGSFQLEKDGAFFAIPGQGVAAQLGISINFDSPLHVYVPKKGLRASVNPSSALNHDYIFPAGVFSLLEEVDAKVVFVPIEFARQLFESESRVSALEVQLGPGVSAKNIQKQIRELTNNRFYVKNKYQQHDMLYKTMKSEKWATYLILAFILVIASFNILGSLSMLIIDKKEDISVLQSMGASRNLIRQIFLYEGWLISIAGAAVGLTLGVLVCWVQIHFQLIGLPGNGSFVISAYPVEIEIVDLFVILAVVLSVGFLAAWYPIRFITANDKQKNLAYL